jgi:integrase
MARNKQFWAKTRARKYKGQARKVNRAYWIGPDGLPDSTEREDWTLKEALDFAGEQWLKVRGGTFANKSSARMDDAIGLWLKDLDERRQLWIVQGVKTKKSVSGAYLKSQKLLAETVLSPMFGSLRPSEIDKRFIERWARQVLVSGEMTAYEVNYAAKRVAILLDHAQEQGWIALNPLRKVKLDLPEVAPANVIVPEDEDIVALLRTIEADYCRSGESELLFSSMRMAIFLVAYAGLRPNEASALYWEDIDLDRMEINQHRGFTYEEGHKPSGKTRASTRLIDILPQLHHELKEYQRRTIEITPRDGRLATWQALAERNANPTGLVLCNAHVGTLSAESIGIHWRKLRARVTERDLTKITLYSLRHYAGSIWLRDGMSLPRVSAMMGHTDIRTTEKIYIKILRELDEDRLHGMRQIGHGLDRRYRALGLALGHTTVPVLTPPQPIVERHPLAQLAPPAPTLDGQDSIVPIPAVTAVPMTLAEMREAVKRDVLAMFDAGMAPPVIARKKGISRGTVVNYIDDRNTAVAYGPSKWDEPAETKTARYAEAKRLAEEGGLSYREIGLLLGIKVGALRGYASRHGWKATTKPVRYTRANIR